MYTLTLKKGEEKRILAGHPWVYANEIQKIEGHGEQGSIARVQAHDGRFLEAFEALKSKTVDGQIIVERVVPKLASLTFCAKGKPSALATKRYNEILVNLAK